MKLGELREAQLAFFQEPHFNSAPVLRANVAPHKTHFFASCYERRDPVICQFRVLLSWITET
ncbi:MAG: hypothetical protein WCC90_11955, partial [Methylocella sp.]